MIQSFHIRIDFLATRTIILYALVLAITTLNVEAQKLAEDSGETICPAVGCYWSGCSGCGSNCYSCDEIEDECGYTCEDARQRLEQAGEVCVDFTPTATPTATFTPTPTPVPVACLTLNGNTVRTVIKNAKEKGFYDGDVLQSADLPGCGFGRNFSTQKCSGQYRRDDATLNALCKIAFEYRGTPCKQTISHDGPYGGRSSLSSPGNNSCGYWKGGTFELVNATNCQGNMWFGDRDITCHCGGGGGLTPACVSVP
jgi:hypothetical protein